MYSKTVRFLFGLWIGCAAASADVSEMIFYPEADFSEGALHFNYQGQKRNNYGFMFERGFDPERIVYVRPLGYSVEKVKDGSIKLLFSDTDRYSYVQRVYRDDFLVSEEKGAVKILLSGGDCTGSADCVTAENILSVNVPKGYSVRSYQGLDQNLKPLKNPQWQRKGNLYTLTVRDVQGAHIMMELEKSKPGLIVSAGTMKSPVPVSAVPEFPQKSEPSVQKLFKQAVESGTPLPKPPPIAAEAPKKAPLSAAEKPVIAPVPQASAPLPKPVLAKPAPLAAASVPKADVLQPAPALTVPPVKSAAEKPAFSAEPPAPYFRNFQIFESRRVLELSDEGKERLREWAKQFKEGGYKSVVLNSYTDDIPPQRLKHLYATNEVLSSARAQLVAEYLASVGMDSKAITVKGLGALNPVVPNDTEEGRSKNRRIEFVLTR